MPSSLFLSVVLYDICRLVLGSWSGIAGRFYSGILKYATAESGLR